MQKTFLKLVPETPFHIKTIEDLVIAMDQIVQEKKWEKSYLYFDWGDYIAHTRQAK
ncbi:hypothetical protein [Siminovitchia sp. FSL W7-1587]|uniref:hypothetical protein n=1 Tax=Siminovitchia sp. FSL W7-1587 TaxID=2954699 RepID=UPI0030D05639